LQRLRRCLLWAGSGVAGPPSGRKMAVIEKFKKTIGFEGQKHDFWPFPVSSSILVQSLAF